MKRYPSTSALFLVTIGAALASSACSKTESAPAPAASGSAASASAAAPVTVTILETADENGYLLPTTDEKGSRGGAAQLAGVWEQNEKHCPGTLKGGAPACPEDKTLVLTGGDHFNGAAISSFFRGESAADVMGRMGYAASALGNNELDYGRDAFLENQKRAGFPYVAANVKAKGDGLGTKDFEVFERAGAKIAVVGLASTTSAETAMEGRFEGVTFEPYEQALARVVPQAAAKADAVILLAHECPSQLKPVVEGHPEWKLAAVLGAHCREPYNDKAGKTPLVSPGKHFEHYARVELSIDKSKPQGERVVSASAKVVDVPGTATPQPDLAAVVKSWQTKLDTALGEEVGFTKKGLPKDSPELARWVTSSIRESTGADVAVLNKKGIRAGLPAGKITKEAIYSVLPFDNSVMLVSLTGEQLQKELANEEAIYAGVTKAGKDWKDAKGQPIDPKKTYTVATVEYLYFGGAGFHFEDSDKMPRETGMVWQTPVIEWTKKQSLSDKKPLEATLPKS